ncbi:protein of unknown function [Paraburkholderia tuberum]|uniref:DUF1330 domain-containing protein n=1 Tax=Paraburkholderia tuberum TaxID=157910 RepID=A0A1H1KHS2_9BURK|nr:protein of unknown function [Paraburkholderia tuberum]
MATYIVFTKESTQDQGELDTYQSKVGETFRGHPVKILAAYGPQQILEGDAPEGVVIVEFPSTAARARGTTARRIRRSRSTGSRARAIAPFSSKACDERRRRSGTWRSAGLHL